MQQGNIIVADDKTLIDYINQYQAEAQNDRIHRFAVAIGIDEVLLRNFMERNITIGNINELGLFDQLKATVDKNIAKKYFEKIERQPIKAFLIPAKIDTILRQFILSGGFDVN